MLARIASRHRVAFAGMIAPVVIALVSRRHVREDTAVPMPAPTEAGAEPSTHPIAHRDTLHTVEAVDPGIACGVFYGVGQVRYNDLTMLVPCFEFYPVRFALGDQHVLEIEGDEVVAIKVHGRRTEIHAMVAPYDVFGHLSYMFDGKLHFSAPGWQRTMR